MDRVSSVMQQFDRRDFVPKAQRMFAGFDRPLPIGYGQTISQPSTVQRMLTWLDVRAGDRVLDIGSGSGWTAAILSRLVGPDGYVHAVERIPQLVERGRTNCAKYDISNVEFFAAGSVYGLPDISPYDRILVSAAANELPVELIDQLHTGGKMVIPVDTDIFEIAKTSHDQHDITRHSGFVFVPLVSQA